MEHLDGFCSAYMDDTLIFSKSQREHEQHVKQVLQKLRDAGLQADITKCEFHVTETKFLGFIVGVDGIQVNLEKVAVVRDWIPPTKTNGSVKIKGVQAFLGFCNFYRKFIRDYGRIV
jgi:hypothetical protein